MKKLVLTALTLLSISIYSQSATKKYNDYYKRYEYFDSRGNMTGYETYNSYYNRWEYYDVNQTNNGSYQYRDPQALDISVLGQAALIKDRAYTNNFNLVQSNINSISNSINNLQISQEQKQSINDKFATELYYKVNTKNYDYSSSVITKNIIDWCYTTINSIIKDVTTPKGDLNYSAIQNNIGKTLDVYKISVYSSDNKKLRDEIIKSNSFVNIQNDMIKFKRADGSESFRQLQNKVYNSEKQGYEYTSINGATFINKDLKYVEFFTDSSATGENYTYFISR